MSNLGNRVLLGNATFGAGLPPADLDEVTPVADTLGIAHDTPTYIQFGTALDSVSLLDFFSYSGDSTPLINDTVTIADEGGMIGAMAIEDVLDFTDTNRSWVPTSSTNVAPVNDAVTIADEGGMIGAMAIEDLLGFADTNLSWVPTSSSGTEAYDGITIADQSSLRGVIVPDTLGIGESYTMEGRATINDSIGLTESVVYAFKLADTLGLADSAPTYGGATVQATDTLAIVDGTATYGGATFQRTDTLAIVDGTPNYGVGVQQDDTLGVTDGTQTVTAGAVQASDTLGITDGTQTVTAGAVQASDTLGIADNGAVQSAATASNADTVGVADGTATWIGTYAAADTLAVADNAAASAMSYDSADTLAVADGTATWVGSVPAADTLGLTDGTQTVTAGTVQAADTLGIADTSQAVTSGTVAGAETLAIVDGTPSYGVGVEQADTLAIADGTQDVTAGTVQAADTLAIADTPQAATGGSLTQPDTLAIADTSQAATGGSLTQPDTLAIADTSQAVTAGSLAQPDTLAITDGTQEVTAGTVAAADTLAVADTSQEVTGGAVAASDTLAVADGTPSWQDQSTDPAPVDDTLAITDGTATYTATYIADDTLAIADTSQAATDGSLAQPDTLAIADGTQTITAGTVTAADTLTIADGTATYTATYHIDDTLAIADGTAGIVGSGTLTTAADTLAIADATPTATQDVTFVATGTVGSGTTGVTPAQPSGVATGDLLVLLCETANEAVSTPSGWTIAPSSPQSVGTAGATTATRLSIFYRIATGSDAAVISDPGDHLIARIIAYRGVNTTTPFQTSTGDTASASTTATIPGITTTQANTRVLLCLANAFDGTTSQAGALSNSNLISINERIDDNTNSGNGGGITLNEAVKVLPGAIGSSTLTLANSVVQARIALALNAIAVTISGGGSSGISVLQVTPEESFDGVTGLTKNITGVTAGSLLVATLAWGDQSNSSSKTPPTTPSGWTVAIAPNSSVGSQGYKGEAAIYYKENAASGSHSLVVTDFRTDCYAWASITEVAGCLTSGALDQTAGVLSTANSTSSSLTATSPTTTQANEIVFAVGSLSGAGVSAHSIPQSDYTEIGSEPTDAVHTAYGSGYKIVSATGAQSAQVTVTGSTEGQLVLATFKGA